MKAKKLIGLMALASCVMLAGCGGNEDIVITDLPSEFILGQEIDLDQYISCGKDNNYKIVIPEESVDFVETNGHKVKVVSDEEISNLKLKVVAGENEKEISFSVISQIRKDVRDYIDGVTYNYVSYDWYDDYSGSFTVDAYYHGENYAYFESFVPDDEGNEINPWGYVKMGDVCYAFETDENFQNVSLIPEIVPTKTFMSNNTTFNLDMSKLQYIKEGEGDEMMEALFWTVTDENDYSLLSFLQGTTYFSQEDSSGDYVEPIGAAFYFAEIENDDGSKENQLFCEIYCYSYYYQTVDYCCTNSFSISKDGNNIPALDAMLSAGAKPEFIDFTDIKNAGTSIFNGSNYTFGIKYGWVDVYGEPTDAPDFTDDEMFDEAIFPTGNVVTAVTDKAAITYEVDDSDEAKDAYYYANGLFEKDGKVYNYVRKSADEAAISVSDRYSSMSESYKEKAYFMFDYLNAEYYPEDLFYCGVHSVDDGETTFGLNYIRYENIFKGILDRVPDLANTSYFEQGYYDSFKDFLDLYEGLDKDPEYGSDDLNAYNWLDSYVVLDDGKSYINYVFDFVYDGEHVYEIVASISKVGTTEIPADIASQFVVPGV